MLPISPRDSNKEPYEARPKRQDTYLKRVPLPTSLKTTRCSFCQFPAVKKITESGTTYFLCKTHKAQHEAGKMMPPKPEFKKATKLDVYF